MKAKELAKFLLKHPEAEIITREYLGDDFFVSIEHAALHQKGTKIPNPVRSSTESIGQHGTCKVDVIYIGSSKR